MPFAFISLANEPLMSDAGVKGLEIGGPLSRGLALHYSRFKALFISIDFIHSQKHCFLKDLTAMCKS